MTKKTKNLDFSMTNYNEFLLNNFLVYENGIFKNMIMSWGIRAHTFNSRTQQAETDISEFKASLVYK